MLASVIGLLTIFSITMLGVGWPVVARLPLRPPEKLLATVAVSATGAWLLAWPVYVFAWSTAALWTIPALGAVNLALSHRSWLDVVRDADARDLLLAQAIVTASCGAWLALIVSYSGGDWVGDWFGHWDRTRFFIERWPPDIAFSGFDPLTSRPPLANVLTGAFLRLSRFDFAHYQIAMTLFNSLAFLPVAILARRFFRQSAGSVPANDRSLPWLAAAFVLSNPLFLQNATYAWTKLMAAFFVLAALYFFLRTQDPDAPRGAAELCAACVASGILVHYSVGPYAVALAAGWLLLGRACRHGRSWGRSSVIMFLISGGLLATWFGWSLVEFGPAGTFLSNSSVTDQANSATEQLGRVALNLRDTIVPYPLRDFDFRSFAQHSPFGLWRDAVFQLYQRNLFFAAGSVGGFAIAILLFHAGRVASRRDRIWWGGFVACTLVLGIAAHGSRDTWGNIHICEQPLVLLGLAFLAAQWPALAPAWRRFVAAGMCLDAVLGIALHFAVQGHLLDHLTAPDPEGIGPATLQSEFARMNARAKEQLAVDFLADVWPAAPALLLILPAVLYFWVLTRASAGRSRARL